MNDLIIKWLDNPELKFTLKELYTILDFIQNPYNQSVIDEHFRQSYREADGNIEQLDDQKIDDIYLLIQSQINKKENREPKFTIGKVSKFFMRAAAILILPVSAFAIYSYFYSSSHLEENQLLISDNAATKIEYFSPPGARTRILLPDSSEVWLNGNSKLAISKKYGIGTRDVELYGEAFFSVKKNASKPFNVYTPDATLQVLGTTFNVSAYEKDAYIETTLISGEVNLIYSNKEDKTNLIKIQPSQKVSLSKNEKKITTEVVDTQVYQSWKDGKIILRNHSLKQVVSILERWFNVNISYDNNLEDYKFTATLDNKSLDQILMFISFSSPINYTFNDNSVHLTARN